MADITFFYQKNEDGTPVLDESGNPVFVDVGQSVSVNLVKAMILDNRPQKAIDAYIDLATNTMNQEMLKSRLFRVDSRKVAIEEAIKANEELAQDETNESEPVPIPEELPPFEFTPVTKETVLELVKPELQKRAKRLGMEYDGVPVSLTEENQNGIAAVLKGLELAEKYQQDVFPLNFNASTMAGTQSISFNDVASFELFALHFMAARQAYFQ